MGNRKSREFRQQQERQASWDRLRLEPWSPYSDDRAFGSGAERIQIVCLPSFSKASFWEVAELRPEWVLYTATVVDPDRDALKVLGYERVEFPSDKLKGYYERLTSVSVPAAPLCDVGGADGTTTQLALFGGMSAKVRYQWWSEFPPKWKPLVEIVQEMLRDFGESEVD